MEPYTYVAVLSLATVSGLTTVIGVLLAIYVTRSIKWIPVGIGFSVGIMLSIALFELIPESLTSAKPINVVVAISFGSALMGLLHYVIPHTHLFEEKGLIGSDVSRTAYLVALGLILHDFPEGFAMANAYITYPSMGVVVALAIAVHNIPEEFAMAVPIIATRSRAFLLRAAIISGSAEPAGATIGLLTANADPGLVPIFMAFAAGAMVFVSLHELVPMAKQYGELRLFGVGLFAGVLAYTLLASLIPN